MAFIDEAIVKMRTEQEKRERLTNIDLSRDQTIYGKSYGFGLRTLFEDQIALLVPKEFVPMPEFEAGQKYLTAQKPQVILTSSDYTTNITMNLLTGTLKTQQISLCLQKMKSTILKVYPATLFYNYDLKDMGDLTVAYMDFKSYSLSAQIYNIMFASSFRGRPLIGTFNCSFDQWEEWRPVAIEMIQSIREVGQEESV